MSEKNNKLKLFYRKVKFLIPMLFATAFVAIISIGEYGSAEILMTVITYLAVIPLSWHYWKFDRNEEYKIKALEREKEQKALPLYLRNNATHLMAKLEGLRICAIIIGIAAFVKAVSYIFDGLFIYSAITFFASIFCYLIVRAINKIKPF